MTVDAMSRWQVPAGATFEDTFGKGSSLSVGPAGGAWCLEAEIVTRFRDAGWHAGWLNPWRIRSPQRRFPLGWSETMWSLAEGVDQLPERAARLALALTREWVLDHGGVPDVMASRPGEPERWLLIEGKATGRSSDRVSCKQVRWLRQARRLRLTDDDFAVVSVLVR
jgi:hypothetical protein